MTDPLTGDQVVTAERWGGGVVPVGVGLAVFGLATYGYLSFAARGLAAEAFAPLSVMWTLLNALGIGLFQPFEQELGRLTAARSARGEGNRPVVRTAVAAAGLLLLVAALVCLVAVDAIGERLFAGERSLVVLFVLSLVGMAAAYVVRGLLSGNARFGHYGAQLAADGVLRVAGAGALWAGGVTDLAPYGLVLVASPVLAVVLTTPRPGRLVHDGPPYTVAAAASALGALVAASLLSQGLANAGPVVVQLLAGPAERTAAGDFTAALVIARVPLFAFAAVQAVLLPGLATLVGRGDRSGFGRRVGLVLAVTGGLGGVGAVGVWLLGPWLVGLIFGPGFGVGRGVVTLIALSGALFMVTQALAQAGLALRGEVWVVGAWGAGLLGLVVATALPGTAVDRAAWALVVGSACALVVMSGGLLAAVRRWRAEEGR